MHPTILLCGAAYFAVKCGTVILADFGSNASKIARYLCKSLRYYAVKRGPGLCRALQRNWANTQV